MKIWNVLCISFILVLENNARDSSMNHFSVLNCILILIAVFELLRIAICQYLPFYFSDYSYPSLPQFCRTTGTCSISDVSERSNRLIADISQSVVPSVQYFRLQRCEESAPPLVHQNGNHVLNYLHLYIR